MPPFALWPEAAFLQRLLQRPGRPGGHASARTRGAHAGRSLGLGTTFRDHRPYAAGDDLRHMNWNLMARLGRPMVRRFETEASMPLNIVLDVSASMGVGQPSKLLLAWRLVLAFAFAAKGARDPAQVWLANTTLVPALPDPNVPPQHLAETLYCLQAAGGTDLAAVAQALLQEPAFVQSPGTLVWLSDFLAAQGIEAACAAARRLSQSPVFVQLEAPLDSEPELCIPPGQTLALQDAESHRVHKLAFDDNALASYYAQHKLYNEALARLCLRHNIRLLRVSSTAAFEATALRLLRQTGLWA